jgi:hypothetical protein
MSVLVHSQPLILQMRFLNFSYFQASAGPQWLIPITNEHDWRWFVLAHKDA